MARSSKFSNLFADKNAGTLRLARLSSVTRWVMVEFMATSSNPTFGPVSLSIRALTLCFSDHLTDVSSVFVPAATACGATPPLGFLAQTLRPAVQYAPTRAPLPMHDALGALERAKAPDGESGLWRRRFGRSLVRGPVGRLCQDLGGSAGRRGGRARRGDFLARRIAALQGTGTPVVASNDATVDLAPNQRERVGYAADVAPDVGAVADDRVLASRRTHGGQIVVFRVRASESLCAAAEFSVVVDAKIEKGRSRGGIVRALGGLFLTQCDAQAEDTGAPER